VTEGTRPKFNVTEGTGPKFIMTEGTRPKLIQSMLRVWSSLAGDSGVDTPTGGDGEAEK